MDLKFTPEQEAFRREAREWLESNLTGKFAKLLGRGGPGDEDYEVDLRIEWGKVMGKAGWNCVGWPKEAGGRGLSVIEETIWNEEYVRARAPGRIGHVGETLLGPTIIHFGTEEQKKRFLPPILAGEELWCQKIWTSLAPWSQWCFVLARTDPESTRHKGISYLLVPMDQPGIEIRPIVQITGGAEFAEVFFDGAKCPKENVVGGVGNGWKVAMGTLAFERGASTLGQQAFFEQEFELVAAAAKKNGKANDPVYRQKLADAWIRLKIMRLNALRILSNQGSELTRDQLIAKLYWSNWHRDFGKLALDVLGPEGEIAESFAPYELWPIQKAALFARSDTIYAGSNEIQRNIIAERVLGLPREGR